MLNNKICRSLFKTIQARYFMTSELTRAEAAANIAPTYGPTSIQRCELMNGVKIAAAKQFGDLLASCTIMFSSAGTRVECGESLGANHFIRNTSDTTSCRYSDFIKIRKLKERGAFIYCTSDRQSVQFTLKCRPEDFEEFKLILWDTALKCQYPQHELNDRKHQLKGDLTRLSPEQRVMDLIQTASFTGPLANSNYCVKERIDSMTHDIMNDFISSNFRVDECSIGAVGIPYTSVLGFAEMLEPRKERQCPRESIKSSFRNGYEFYDLGQGSDCYIALAIPGCGSTDCNLLFHYAIIAHACGAGRLTSGQHETDRTMQAPLGLMDEDIYTEFLAFNISYKETGIFGIFIKCRPCNCYPVTTAAVEFLRTLGQLTVKHIEHGKQRLKLNLAINEQKHQSKDLAFQMANTVLIDGVGTAIGIIDSYQHDAILTTAKMLAHRAKTSMSLATVGDLGAMPADVDVL